MYDFFSFGVLMCIVFAVGVMIDSFLFTQVQEDTDSVFHSIYPIWITSVFLCQRCVHAQLFSEGISCECHSERCRTFVVCTNHPYVLFAHTVIGCISKQICREQKELVRM